MRGPVIVSSLFVVVGLALGGCGGCNDGNNVGHLPDAPPGSDAMEPDAVSLVVINQGVPVGGVPVYFLNADGSVASATVTDGTGTASAVVTAGGSVTAVRPFSTQAPTAAPGGDELRTFLAVRPGDHLVLNRAPTDSVTVTFDAVAPNGGDFGTAYHVVTTCGSGVDAIQPGGSSNGSESPDPGATGDLHNCQGAADIAVVASGGGLDGAVSLYHPNESLPPGGTVTVNLRADTYATATDVTFTYTNAPDADISVLHSSKLMHGYLGPYSTTVPAGSSEVTLPEATVPAEMEVVDSSLLLDSNQHEVVDWGPFSATYTADLNPSTVLLRAGIAGPTFDIPTRKLTWVEASTGVVPDLTIAAIQVARADATWRWEIATPYVPEGIVFPSLPADAATWIPTTGDTVTPEPISNVRVSGGYNAVRAHIFDVPDGVGPIGLVIGSGGRAVIVQYPVAPPAVRSRR